MQANFTPGPWRVGDAGCTVFGPPNGNPAPKRIADMAKTPEYKTNARLIAAAPDLYAALEELLEAFYSEHQAIPGALSGLGEEGRQIHARNVAASRAARAALSRARGE